MSIELNNIWGIIPSKLTSLKSMDKVSFESLSKQINPQLNNSQKAEVRGNIAILPVFGMIVPRDFWYYRTSLEELANDLTVAINNPSIKAIILNMDSPGGIVTACVEITSLIRQYKTIKPIIAFASGTCASACYWIASACTEIIVSATSESGSLGVIWETFDSTIRDERDGYENIQIVSEVSPDKRPDIKTPEGKAIIQKLVNSVAEAMYEDVAKNRNVSVDFIKSNYGKGGLFIGQQIVDQKMAESVNTLEGVIEKYKSYSNLNTKGAVMSIAIPSGESTVPTISAESIQKDHPSIYQAIFNAGKSEGVKAECDRIKKIEASVVPGFDELVASMKFDSTKSDSDLCVAIIQQQKAQTSEFQANKTNATNLLNDKLKGVGSSTLTDKSKADSDKATIKAAAEKLNKQKGR